MIRPNPAYALFIAAWFFLAGSALAQTPGQQGRFPGNWDRQGRWIGYVPAHLKYAGQGGQAFASPTRASAGSDVNAGIAAPLQDDSEPADASVELPAVVTAGPDSSLDQQPAVPVSFDLPVPIEIDGAYVGDPVFPPAASVPCDVSGFCSQVCCSNRSLWGRVEYLGWWTDGMDTPPLVTTNPDGDTPREQAGVLGQPGTTILFGNSGLNRDARSGGRITLGVWLDPCDTRGVEATYMALGEETETFAASSADFSILGRPFFNVQSGQQDVRLIAFPGLAAGSILVTADTEFQGAEVLFKRVAALDGGAKIDLLLGWRWTQLDDDLFIADPTVLSEEGGGTTTFDSFDRFETRNNFHGAELGLRYQRQVRRCWSLELLSKIALGNTNSVATVDGRTTRTNEGGTTVRPGGLLTQTTNIGRYERDAFASVCEVGITLRRRIRCSLEATFGYTFVYWSNVARAGDQIDLDVNLSQIPPGPFSGAPRPAFAFQSTDFWAQGLSCGLEYRF